MKLLRDKIEDRGEIFPYFFMFDFSDERENYGVKSVMAHSFVEALKMIVKPYRGNRILFCGLRSVMGYSTGANIYHQIFPTWKSEELEVRCLKIIPLHTRDVYTANDIWDFGAEKWIEKNA